MKLGQPLAAFAVAGHHGGLPDGGGRGDSSDQGTFFGRMSRAAQGKLVDYSAWSRELSLPSTAVPSSAVDKLAGMFFTRMLFSCLVDADYTDTGEFMEGQTFGIGETASIEELWARLQSYISGWVPAKRGAERQTLRHPGTVHPARAGTKTGPVYLDRAHRRGQDRGPLWAFALAQAKARGMKRVVYVIPYTSIIEQTADTFRTILGPENMLEHHSGVQFDLPEDGVSTPETERLTRAAETWDMPVVVTTAVQFFESLFSNMPSQCRKLHNLAQSVTFWTSPDAPGALPAPLHLGHRPAGQGLRRIRRSVYGHPACPLPSLSGIRPRTAYGGVVSYKAGGMDAFRRVTFRKVGKLSHEELAMNLQEKGQVLCVVNTRGGRPGDIPKAHRRGKFPPLHSHVSRPQAGVLVKVAAAQRRSPARGGVTSLIEAGVDVDFPAVYRDEAGLDSILQAAGRCNREGDRPPDDSVVTIFRGEGKISSLFATAVGAAGLVLDRYEDIASREAVHAYFSMLLDLKGKAAQDTQHILSLMGSELFPFRTISERFHLINDPTVTVYIPLDEGAEWVAHLRAGEHSPGFVPPARTVRGIRLPGST